jgi:hypothetical protein
MEWFASPFYPLYMESPPEALAVKSTSLIFSPRIKPRQADKVIANPLYPRVKPLELACC